MQLRPITFQADETLDEPFSKYYESFMEIACRPTPTNPAIEAQLVEVLRRQRNLPFVTKKLFEEARRLRDQGALETRQHCEQILQFIRLLEGDSTGPPQWLHTTHYDVVFYHSDYKNYADTPEGGSAVTLRVNANLGDDGSWRFSLYAGSGDLCQTVDDAAAAAALAAKILNDR